ncbi:hypothetical protein Slin15195_G062870 [Septoria linicola]|uniref:Uncharacterized protein n=1 Tax=Septoria linicola TaxID=215465 RepID=A0A9Q9EL21_9PEZI|nr:hypothetical protein Slin15195_G062870 [Septoria linicola]
MLCATAKKSMEDGESDRPEFDGLLVRDFCGLEIKVPVAYTQESDLALEHRI